MVPLKPLVPSPAVRVGDFDLLASEAGRSPEGLTATVVLKNGSFSGGCLVCFPKPSDLAAADSALAVQTGLEPGTFAKPLLELWERVEGKLQQGEHRRRDRAARNGQEARPRPLTDLGNAERLVDRHGRDLLYCYHWKEWLVYDGTRWRRDQAGRIVAKARETVRSIYGEAAAERRAEERAELAEWAQKSEARKSIEAMIALAQSYVPVAPDQLDTDPWLLNCANGTIDLRTGALREHRREDLLTKWTPVVYDRDGECSGFTCFVAEIMDDQQELVDFLQRALGYSLTGDCREQCLFLLHGSGSNGKSLLLSLIQAAAGDYAFQAVSDLLLANRFDSPPTARADLFGKRLVATIEVEEGRRLAESLTKQLTGGDRIRARRMFQDFWEFAPTHKIWLAANHKPVIRGTDNAIWRRIHLVPFTVQFTLPGQGQDEAPIGQQVGLPGAVGKVADPQLGDKLRAELPGILAWLVRGCLGWQAEGLKPPQVVKEATAAYREEMDVLRGFLEDKCVQGPKMYVLASELYAAYRTHCEQSGEEPLTQKALAPLLRQRGFECKHTNRGNIWCGVGLRATPDPGGVNRGEPLSGAAARKSGGEGNKPPTVNDASHRSPDVSAGTDGGAAVKDVKLGDALEDSSAIGPRVAERAGATLHQASPSGEDDASGCVTNVSRDPKTPHPMEPCAREHLEWELASSDPHRGEPRWYGYVCRTCRPVEQYGCWLPLGLQEEGQP